ncbi:hypothetical protein PN419_07990 [Halorubrum ezzemoulense]|nr:hypothetical protein [Halorubrum ezzemoulense]MDB9258712.1 hypothetical protein [Halorubrum ezzemoulense]MDB9262709.1 hypothetical protein [Halorubrum ezzemoulense]MDB9265731.1 hypothetical protein [Halorubrum ezzemoulense]MDB9269073.1 hypothetical protein [Halorubrum ezzemoulense]
MGGHDLALEVVGALFVDVAAVVQVHLKGGLLAGDERGLRRERLDVGVAANRVVGLLRDYRSGRDEGHDEKQDDDRPDSTHVGYHRIGGCDVIPFGNPRQRRICFRIGVADGSR